MAKIPRHLITELKRRGRLSRAIYLFGARQTGKTTLAKAAFPKLPYASLEDPDIRQRAASDPREFLAAFPAGAVLDEVQRVPEILSYLQGVLDHTKARFVLTGSQNFLLMDKISQSLAGRVTLLELPPFSYSEINRQRLKTPELILQKLPAEKQTRSAMLGAVLTGGYPEPTVHPKVRDYWYMDYIRTFVERDIRTVVGIKDTLSFQRFLGLCAGRSGSLLNLDNLASDAGISQPTCKSWVGALQASGIIHLLKPFHQNFNKRLIKSSKLYFCDTGLLCRLIGIRDSATLSTHPLAGHIFETWVVGEFRKTLLNLGEIPSIYFWRDNHGDEIDLLIEHKGHLLPIEIKMGTTIVSDHTAPMRKWLSLANIPSQKGYLIYGGDSAFDKDPVKIRPWFYL